MSLNPGEAVAPPKPTVKPQAFPLSNATTGQALRPTAPIGRSTSTIPDASAAQASLPPQTSDQGVTAVPARPLWPEPSIASVNTQPSDAIPKQSQTETVQATADTGAADDVDKTAQGNVSTSKTGSAASLISGPAARFSVAALGLLAVGFLLRVMVKMVVRRRRRIAIDRHDFDWTDDQHEEEVGDNQFVRQQLGLSDYLKHSNIPIENRIGDELPNNARGRMPGAPFGNKVNTPEHRRINPNTSESDWIDDRSRHGSTAGRQQSQPVRMDTPAAIDAARQSIDAGDEFINDLQNSLTAVGGHQPVRAPVQADDASSGEITEREEVLDRLRRDLDRLLQSPKVA
jgi:hypothetical protein